MEYQISREQCQKQIDENGNVCSQCGGVLVPIDTVDNAGSPTHWIGCLICERFDHGVKYLIFEMAKYLVTERHYRAFHYEQEPDKTKEPDRHKYWLDGQIGGMSNQVNEIVRLYEKSTITLPSKKEKV